MQNLCHGLQKEKRGLVCTGNDGSTLHVTVSGRNKHHLWGLRRPCVSLRNQGVQKNSKKNRNTHTQARTNIIDLTPPGGQVSAGPPLVSQWTLLQPRWRMAHLDLSPATNTDDGTGERKAKKKKGAGHLEYKLEPTHSHSFTQQKQSCQAPVTVNTVKKNSKQFPPQNFFSSADVSGDHISFKKKS